MLVYADEADLSTHVVELPDNADTLLRFASVLVRKATRFDVYDITPAGMPDDPWVIEAFRDATCVQAAMWAQNGVDPTAGSAGVDGGVESSSIAGGTVKYDTSHVDAARSSVDTLSPMAVAVLRAEGLASHGVAS